MNTAEYLVKKLEELGINDFFGVAGDYNFDILYAIDENPNTNWIGCTNELNAGYAADGYARQRGFGAIVTTYGVGELSSINAIAGSFAENIPVINIVGVPSSINLETKALLHHNFQEPQPKAYENAFKNVTETTAFLNRDNAKIEIDRVLITFIRERKPIYIAIPMDIAQLEISIRDANLEWVSDSEVLELVINKINKKIKESKNPVILGDTLIKRFDARIEYKEFVEKSGLPVTNFLMGTNLIDSDYKNYLGTYFADLRNPVAQKALDTTDCLVADGAIYSDLNAFGFKLPYKINSHIAIYGTYTYIEGLKYENIKMADVLEGLSKTIETRETETEKPNYFYEKSAIKEEHLTSEYIYSRLQEFIKENDILIAETGTIPQGVAQMKFPHNSELITQTLWGSIGWATPATFGVCIANPNSRVVLFTGDGAHQVSALEIGNMLKQGAKPIIIVLNNGGYTIERVLSKNPDDKFNDILHINYSKFARIFEGDIWATKVSTPDDFDKALKVTQIMNKLCYIEVCTDKMEMPKLTQDMIAEIKKTAKEQPKPAPYKFIKEEENISLKKDKHTKFETTVHTSLKDIGE